MVNRLPKKQGLYDPANERDSCGIGFVANIKGVKSNEILRRGLSTLSCMEHRGAQSADNKTGDGAGVMIQTPHRFYHDLITDLPKPGRYGTGVVFMPKDPKEMEICVREVENTIEAEGLQLIAWRGVPVDSCVLGNIARSAEPASKQVFIGAPKKLNAEQFERKLYVVRKVIENRIRNSNLSQKDCFYILSLSTRVVLYKGMLMPYQLEQYYVDLQDSRIETAIALVHSRFSTNTFPCY